MLLEQADDQAAATAATALASNKNPLLAAILDACETLKALQLSAQASADEAARAAQAAVERLDGGRGGKRGKGGGGAGGGAGGAFSGDALASANGLIFMRTDKIGFGVSVTQGYGLLLARRPAADPSSGCCWSPPVPLKVDGCSLGAVVGYSEQRTLLALATEAEVRELCGGGGGGGDGAGGSAGNDDGHGGHAAASRQGRRVKVGLDLNLGLGKRLNQSASVDAKQQGVAAGGGGGGEDGSEHAAAATAAPTTRAFTLSKGFIVDVSLRGLFVEPDVDDLARAYGEGITAEDVLFGVGAGGGAGGSGGIEGGAATTAALVRAPPEAALLYRALQAAEQGDEGKA